MSLLRARGLATSSVVSAQPDCSLASAPLAPHRLLLALVASAAVVGTSPTVAAAPQPAKSTDQSGASAKAKPPCSRAPAKGKSKAEEEAAALAAGKVAVLAFDGEDTYSVRDHVIQALADRGMKVEGGLPAVDTDEQYRDMGALMDVAVYVNGRIRELPADHAVATITIRSGVTGEEISTTKFTGFRRGLPFDVEEKLWERLGAAFARACMEATKPRPHYNKPMVIEAGHY
jgi:hypothetical protein